MLPNHDKCSLAGNAIPAPGVVNQAPVRRMISTGLSDIVGDQAIVSQVTQVTPTGINDIRRIGGINKKIKFNWSPEFSTLLINCSKICKSQKELHKLFKEEMFKLHSIKYSGSLSSITNHLNKLKHQNETTTCLPKKNIKWSGKICDDLLICGMEALAMKERNNKVSYINIMYEKFITIHPEYMGGPNNLRTQYAKISKNTEISIINKIWENIDNDLTIADLKKSNDDNNLPVDMSKIKKYFEIGIEHSGKSLFVAICYRCGKLLFGDSKDSRWKIVSIIDNSPIPITICYDYLPKSIPYKSSNGYYICKVCQKVSNILEYINLLNPESKTMSIPKELKDITHVVELGMIALLGVYHNVYTRQNPMRRIYTHLQGEVNLLSKGEEAYIKMFGIMKERIPLDKNTDRFVRVSSALKWLLKWNPLFKEFHANCETIYGHFKENNPLLLKGAGNYFNTKDKEITDDLGGEKLGYFLPAEQYDAQHEISEEDFPMGITHPKEITKDEAVERLNRLTRPGIMNPKLEAMAFPRDFPGSSGSYDPKSPIKHRDWCKLLLLNWDSRFRLNRYLKFFMIDRYLKFSLLQQKRCVIGPVGKAANKNPTVGDLDGKSEHYKRYGSKVPATIPGSRSYWWQATQEVHAITIDMGCRPDYFLTFTANDNWPEVQRCVYHGPDVQCDKCPHEDETKSAVDYATECSIAFHQRWNLWKRSVLHNHTGELGHVIRYWFRREYQKRGSVHIHGAVWVNPESKPPSPVRAEMPRGSDNLNETLRELVRRLQTHKCIESRCYFSGTKRLQKCKYGFPAPLVYETRVDESRLRKLYMRRLDEDRNIVPYCYSMILIMRSHTNIQEVSEDGWEMYLTKYMTKPEPTARVRYGGVINNKTSNTERFLTMRVIGAIEVNDVLLQFPAKECNVDVLYLPIELISSTKVLKRKEHLPKDKESTDVYYDSKMEKYLMRPKELDKITYPDFYREYKYQCVITEDNLSDESNNEEEVETPNKFKLRDRKKRVIVKRRHNIVVRFPFILPYGEETERFCLKILLENIPLNEESIHNLISNENGTKTYLEECVIRNLWDLTKVSLNFMDFANKMGFNELRLREFAGQLVTYNYLNKATIQEWFETHSDRDIFANFPKYNVEGGDVDEGEYPVPQLNLEALEKYEQTFNEEQSRIFHHIEENLKSNKQVLAAIVGPAGTGKSHLLKAFCALSKRIGCSFGILAPTGAAAYLIKGQTIHSKFKLDVKLKSRLSNNTIEALQIIETDLWLIDEMSMIDDQLFDMMEKGMRDHTLFKQNLSDFGGKNVILFGDPAQLPSRNMPFFCGQHFEKFKIYTLNIIVRQEDIEFAQNLRKVRIANITPELIIYFKQFLINNIDYQKVIEQNIHIVVARRDMRDNYNQQILNMLPGEEKIYIAKDTDISGGNLSSAYKIRLEKLTEKFKTEIRLKIGALVTLTRNINTAAGLVNGRIAIVESCGESYVMLKSIDGKEHFTVQLMKQTLEDYGEDRYIRYQLPIDLAWASTVHKVQGRTLDKVIVVLDENFFDSGMAYVALTRVRKPENLELLVFDHKKIWLNDFYRELLHWIDHNEIFSKNYDQTYPFPIWTSENAKIKDIDNENIHTSPQQKRTNSGSDKEASSVTRIIQNDLIYTPIVETMNEKCDRILFEMLRQKIYKNDYGESLQQYLEQYQTFNDQVLMHLQTKEPVILSDTNGLSVETSNNPVPHSMREGYRIVVVPGDGNCWYYACSLSLFGEYNLMSVFRYASVLAISAHSVYFGEYARRYGTNLLEILLSVGTKTDNECYTKLQYDDLVLDDNFSWSDNIQQLSTSLAINRTICIYAGELNNTTLRPSNSNDNRKPICIQLKHRHFNSVVPINETSIIERNGNHGLIMDHITNLPIYPYRN